MAIRYSDSALATQLHPIVRVHPETGRIALFVIMGYSIGIEGMTEVEATTILMDLFAHQSRSEFIYRHRWSANMLVMWDNRCVIHAATWVSRASALAPLHHHSRTLNFSRTDELTFGCARAYSRQLSASSIKRI